MGEELRLFNTLSGAVEPLAPERSGEVRLYVCGPTVYDVPHVGHARCYVAYDVLARHLRARGQRVTYVRNVTDVDDKILNRAREGGEEPLRLSARMTEVFQREMRELGCEPPDVEPRVSEHIPEILALIETLVARGAAYPVKTPAGATDVYFSVRHFPGYGKLSRRNVDDLLAGARVEPGEVKRDPLDFALWKGAPEDGWGWDSPFGKGRPGWHIECSAMAARYLGHGFEIHAGGMDLIFPHHENEIAQSEAAHPGAGSFARVWVHNGFVNVDREKMAKSLGNFVTVRQVLERNDPEALRWFLLTVHYRGPIQFDTERLEGGRVIFPGVLEAERRVDYLYQTLERLDALAVGATGAPAPPELAAAATSVAGAPGRLTAALDDDLNTPVALAVVQELARSGNELCDLAQKRRKDAAWVAGASGLARAVAEALRSCAGGLGLARSAPGEYAERTRARRLGLLGTTAEAIEARLSERAAARSARDFARADRLRAELEGLGIEVLDSPTGTAWRVAPV